VIFFYVKSRPFERPPRPWIRGRGYPFEEIERLARRTRLKIQRDGARRITLFSGSRPVVQFHGMLEPDREALVRGE
jgi:hypothetical protein